MVKEDDEVGDNHQKEGDESDEIGSNPSGGELEEILSERAPQILIGDAGRSSLVLEVDQVAFV